MSSWRELEDAVQEGLRRLWEQESAAHERRPGIYYPSYLGYCLRRQYYIYTLGERPSSEKLAIFATGKGVHEAVAEALRASGSVSVEDVEKDVEISITDEVKLSGRVDIILAEVQGQKAVVEVKSTSRLPDAPLEHHVLQLQVYLHALGLERGALLYWDKRRGSIRAFAVARDEAYLRRAGERAVLLHEYLKGGRPPPREAVVEGRLWECDTCEYRRACAPFLIEGIPEGEGILISEVDGVLVDSSRRAAEALAAVGAPGSGPEGLSPELRRRFYELYYSPELLKLDARGPLLNYAWERRARGARLVIVSDRPAALRRATEEELRSLGLTWDAMILRPEGEGRRWKAKAYMRLADHYRIEEVLDGDRYAAAAASRLGARTLFS